MWICNFQFGFDGLFFARLDYQDYEERARAKTLESVWFGSDSLGLLYLSL